MCLWLVVVVVVGDPNRSSGVQSETVSQMDSRSLYVNTDARPAAPAAPAHSLNVWWSCGQQQQLRQSED
jgi:hypothetical protein